MERRSSGIILLRFRRFQQVSDNHRKIFDSISAPSPLKNMAARALLHIGQGERLRLRKANAGSGTVLFG